MKRLVLAALLIGLSTAAQAQGMNYGPFSANLPALPLPCVSTDVAIVTRGSVPANPNTYLAYQVPATTAGCSTIPAASPLIGSTGSNFTLVTPVSPLAVAAGMLSIATATSSSFGVVEPDNSTVTISAGVLSAIAGGGGISELTGDVTAGPGVGSQAATIANGVVTNTMLVHDATTVNGTSCVLGSTCSITSSDLAIGTTAISGGTSGRILYDDGALLGELATTGSGDAVLASAPTIASLSVTTGFTATGLVTNADLANDATTVNGQSCVLGSTCSVTAAATAITVGTTSVGSGTTGYILYDNGGTLGDIIPTGTGAVVLASSPTIDSGTFTTAFTATGLVTNADLANPATTVNGQTCTLGSVCTVTAAATGVVVGSTTVGSGTTGYPLYDNGGVLGNYTTLPLAYGGTGADLTASAGGIFYSTGSAGAILSGTGTAGLPLLSGSSGPPAWGADPNIAYLDAVQVFTLPQRVKTISPSISTATFTVDFNASQDFKLLLTTACPCTITWANIPSVGHQHGVIEIIQSATGSNTIGTWDAATIAAGGVAALTLSTGDNDQDFFSYVAGVNSGVNVLVTPGAQNATH